MLMAIERATDDYGATWFQNVTSLSTGHFLKLLSFYLLNTFISWDNALYLQKKKGRVHRLLHRISNFFLSGLSISLSTMLNNSSVWKAFRFVDDFVFLIDCSFVDIEAKVDEVLPAIKDCLSLLEITCERSQGDSIRFSISGCFC